LLTDLLNDKAQCFIRFDDERQLSAVGITRFSQDVNTGEKTLLFSNLYSFQVVPNTVWLSDLETMKEFARNTGCKKIVLQSSNNRVFNLAEMAGFREDYSASLWRSSMGGSSETTTNTVRYAEYIESHHHDMLNTYYDVVRSLLWDPAEQATRHIVAIQT